MPTRGCRQEHVVLHGPVEVIAAVKSLV